jgi:hypothetical protein
MRIGNYFLHFQHTENNGHRITVCHLHEGPCVRIDNRGPCTIRGLESHTGVARCSSEDTFDKRLGRKLALERALHDVGPEGTYPRTIRSEIWREYFRISKPPRSNRRNGRP